MDDEFIVLAADVGGTYARLGLVHVTLGSRQQLRISTYQRYKSADFSSLSAVFGDFLTEVDRGSLHGAAIASAGYIRDDFLITNNLPWKTSIRELHEELQLDTITIVNDFFALAYGTQFLSAEDTLPILAPGTDMSDEPKTVIGAGTGFGASVFIPKGGGIALTSEAGQAAFAATTELEIEVLRVIGTGRSHVAIEELLSGPGLLNIYRALAQIRGEPASHNSPEAVGNGAVGGHDKLALASVACFCAAMGSVAADLALTFGSRGGLYLAGGVLPHIKDLFLSSDFADRFTSKGNMSDYLRSIPVSLIEHHHAALLGAAGWYRDHLR